MNTTRRIFLLGSGAAVAAQGAASDRVNLAVVGFHGRGRSHISGFGKLPNVRIAALCDADERLFPGGVALVEKLQGHKPDTFFDVRKLLERKDIDAISIATPDYWHALMAIWGCQAGKDVYVEKPVCFTIVEGRRMVQAARKYNRIVQSGLNMRCEPEVRAAMRALHTGKIGKVYRAKIDMVKPRASIGHAKESSIPEGVHWDLYLGPTKMQPFTVNKFHYAWHFNWDTSTTDVGNTGVHYVDAARWGMNKKVHPVKVHSTGGYYIWDSDQNTPNFQAGTFEYADGSILDFTTNNLYAPVTPDANTWFSTEGYLIGGHSWRAFRGKFEPRAGDVSPSGVNEHATNVSFPKATYTEQPIEPTGEPAMNHFENFIACVRSRKREELYCEVEEGFMSSALCHLANISYRLGRKLVFDPATETFRGDAEANRLLTREYRDPYVLPAKV
jgi:predicted dehydrogenase